MKGPPPTLGMDDSQDDKNGKGLASSMNAKKAKKVKIKLPATNQFPIWSKEFQQFIAKCLHKDPLKRPSAKELLNVSVVFTYHFDTCHITGLVRTKIEGREGDEKYYRNLQQKS